MHRNEAQPFAIPAVDAAELSVADADGFLQYRLKNRQKVAWKTADDLEDFGGSRLLLQRLVALARQQRNLLVFATNGRRTATRDLWRIAVL